MAMLKKNRTSRRSRRKAEAAALKHKAGVEAKLGAKNLRKEAKSARKAVGKRWKAERKDAEAARKAEAKEAKAARKAAEKEQKNRLEIADKNLAAAEAGKFDAKTVGRYLGVARTVAPVAVPLAYQGATALRGIIDQRRADRLGVSVDQLGRFSAAGAKLGGRIAGAERTLASIAEDNPKDAETTKFVEAMRGRLKDLSAAVDAAESMPGARRGSAQASIGAELDSIDADLLARLGVK